MKIQIPRLFFGFCEVFIKINILIVTMFTIGTRANPKEIYMILLGIAGIIWIIVPLTKYLDDLYEKRKNDKTSFHN